MFIIQYVRKWAHYMLMLHENYYERWRIKFGLRCLYSALLLDRWKKDLILYINFGMYSSQKFNRNSIRRFGNVLKEIRAVYSKSYGYLQKVLISQYSKTFISLLGKKPANNSRNRCQDTINICTIRCKLFWCFADRAFQYIYLSN